jgi:hypothetical protein
MTGKNHIALTPPGTVGLGTIPVAFESETGKSFIVSA